jgi:hypothetical protein
VKLSRALAPSLLAALALAAGPTGAPFDAAAQPAAGKKVAAPRACGVSAIPLAVGNEWVYESVPPPEDRALNDAQKRTTPVEAKKLTIKVTGIETKDGVTTVALSEDLDGKVHATWIKCTAGGATFQVAPDAFWFAGEAGTTYGIELSAVERKGQSYALTAGKITALEWHDDVVAQWKHVPTAKLQPPMRNGKLELTRHWVLLPVEEVQSKLGTWKAKKLGVEFTINVTIEPAPAEPIRNPPLQVNFLWQVDGVGIVQALNSYGQMYLLTSAVTQ